MFAYQPICNILELKENKGLKYAISWKSNKLCTFKFILLNGILLPTIRQFGYKIGLPFNSSALVVEQNNYTTKVINSYIAYDLDSWPRNPHHNFALKTVFW